MIRILHIVWGLEIGGKERFLDRLMRRLDPQRFPQTICTLRARGPLFDALQKDGHAVWCLEKKPGFDLGAVLRLRREIRDRAPDVVHAHDFSAALASRAALVFRKRPPVAVTLHGLGLTAARRAIYRLLLRRAAAVTVVSPNLAQELAGAGRPPFPADWIPYGVDLAPLQAASDADRTRQRLGLPPSGPVVVMVARLGAPKDHGMVLRAAAEVCRGVPACRFVFVGEGPARPALEAQIRASSLADNVFLVGARPDIPDILALADVCVLASTREASPLAILEYMAAAKPVVATRVGGIPSLLRDGEDGHLVASGDHAALAERILFLLANRQAAWQTADRARQTVRERFSADAMYEAYEDLYRSLAGPNATAERTPSP